MTDINSNSTAHPSQDLPLDKISPSQEVQTKIDQFFKKVSIPRAVGSEGHQQVKKTIKNTFEGLPHVKLTTQPFQAGYAYVNGVLNFIHPISGFMILLLIVLIAGGQDYYLPGIILGFILFFYSLFNRRLVRFLGHRAYQWGRQFSCENIIGTIDPEGEILQTLVFVNHLDSISHRLKPVFEEAGYFTAFIGGLGFAIHVLVFLFQAESSGMFNHQITELLWGIPVALFAIIEIINRKGNESPGFADNASGIVQLYHLALSLQERPLRHTKIILLASDAEELGDYGAQLFLEKYGKELDKDTTKFIVVDSVGVEGRNNIVHSIGLPPRHFSPSLEQATHELMQEITLPMSFQWIPPLLSIETDHIPIDRNGWEFLLFASTSFFYHSKHDSWDKINPEKFLQICEFLAQLVNKIDTDIH